MKKYLIALAIITPLLFGGATSVLAESCCTKSPCKCVKGGCCEKGKCTCKGDCCKDGCKCAEGKCGADCKCQSK